MDAVAESIKQYGFLVPLVISADHEIITGHTRFKAAKKLGLSSVPCVIADELTEEQIKAFRLVDNKVGELAEWDVDLLPLGIGGYCAGFESPSVLKLSRRTNLERNLHWTPARKSPISRSA